MRPFWSLLCSPAERDGRCPFLVCHLLPLFGVPAASIHVPRGSLWNWRQSSAGVPVVPSKRACSCFISYPSWVVLPEKPGKANKRKEASVETFDFLPIRWTVTPCECAGVIKLFPSLNLPKALLHAAHSHQSFGVSCQFRAFKWRDQLSWNSCQPGRLAELQKQVHLVCTCMPAKSLQSCPTLCSPMDWNPPGSSVHGILQVKILEWVTISSSWGSSRPRDRTWVYSVFGTGLWVLYH